MSDLASLLETFLHVRRRIGEVGVLWPQDFRLALCFELFFVSSIIPGRRIVAFTDAVTQVLFWDCIEIVIVTVSCLRNAANALWHICQEYGVIGPGVSLRRSGIVALGR
jgi:hypothetical protein